MKKKEDKLNQGMVDLERGFFATGVIFTLAF
jgi:hypothetical protein